MVRVEPQSQFQFLHLLEVAHRNFQNQLPCMFNNFSWNVDVATSNFLGKMRFIRPLNERNPSQDIVSVNPFKSFRKFNYLEIFTTFDPRIWDGTRSFLFYCDLLRHLTRAGRPIEVLHSNHDEESCEEYANRNYLLFKILSRADSSVVESVWMGTCVRARWGTHNALAEKARCVVGSCRQKTSLN
jgi:hypothetical protein